jgi:hypothetical protein
MNDLMAVFAVLAATFGAASRSLAMCPSAQR